MRQLLLYGLLAVSASARESVTAINVEDVEDENITISALTGTFVVAQPDNVSMTRGSIGGSTDPELFNVTDNDLLYINSENPIEGDGRLTVENVQGDGCSPSTDGRRLQYIGGDGIIGEVTCSYRARFPSGSLQPDFFSERTTVSITVLPPSEADFIRSGDGRCADRNTLTYDEVVYEDIPNANTCEDNCTSVNTGEININNALVGYSYNTDRECFCAYSRGKSPCRERSDPPSEADRCDGFGGTRSIGGISRQENTIDLLPAEECFRNVNFVGIYPREDNVQARGARTALNVLGNDILDVGGFTGRNSQLRVDSVVNVNTEGTCTISPNRRSVIYSTGNPDFQGITFCQYRAILGDDESTTSPLTRINIEVGGADDPTVSPTKAPALIPTFSPTLLPTISPTLAPSLQTNSPIARNDLFPVNPDGPTRVSPLQNDIAQPPEAGPLRIDRLIEVNANDLPNREDVIIRFDFIEETATFILEDIAVAGGGRRLQQIVPSAQGGTCRITNNGQQIVYTPPPDFNGIDACAYVVTDRFGFEDIAIAFFLAQFDPTLSPTLNPTLNPTISPTLSPTIDPTLSPSLNPTLLPTLSPSIQPTLSPTLLPTLFPTLEPTFSPSAPTLFPTIIPTRFPTVEPSLEPTRLPTAEPTIAPTEIPTTEFPTQIPTRIPTELPTTEFPTRLPTETPTKVPTDTPTATPTDFPTETPTPNPTDKPTSEPTFFPTSSPVPGTRPTNSPIINNDVFIVDSDRQTEVAPLDNDIAQPANAGPLRLDFLIEVDNPIVLPDRLDDIEETATLVLESAGNPFPRRGDRRLQQMISSVQGGTCRIANNGIDMVYNPPNGCNGLDACIYVAVDQNGVQGSAVAFLFCQGVPPIPPKPPKPPLPPRPNGCGKPGKWGSDMWGSGRRDLQRGDARRERKKRREWWGASGPCPSLGTKAGKANVGTHYNQWSQPQWSKPQWNQPVWTPPHRPQAPTHYRPPPRPQYPQEPPPIPEIGYRYKSLERDDVTEQAEDASRDGI